MTSMQKKNAQVFRLISKSLKFVMIWRWKNRYNCIDCPWYPVEQSITNRTARIYSDLFPLHFLAMIIPNFILHSTYGPLRRCSLLRKKEGMAGWKRCPNMEHIISTTFYLEICYFYISQTKSSLNKIVYKVVYHHIIYMCDFLVNLNDFFTIVCMDFHEDNGFHQICSRPNNAIPGRYWSSWPYDRLHVFSLKKKP